MISQEYKLVKWNQDGSFEELEVTIDPEAVSDFCDMMGWDGKQFDNNTIRYPVLVEDDDEETEKVELIKKIAKTKPPKFKNHISDIDKEKGDRRKRTHLCEKCKKVVWSVWDNGKQLCEECFSSQEKEKKVGKEKKKKDVVARNCEACAKKLTGQQRRFCSGKCSNDFNNAKNNKGTGCTQNHRKYPVEMRELIKKNLDKSNAEIVELIKEKFGFDFEKVKISHLICDYRLKREKLVYSKKEKESAEKNIGDIIGVHLNRNGGYACNPGCNAKSENMSNDWKYINCKNCIRKFKDKIEPNKPPERATSGKIITSKKQLFPEEVQDFIEKNWVSKPDRELRSVIGDEFGKWYTTEQIKSMRKKRGWTKGKFQEQFEPENLPDIDLNSVEDVEDVLDD